MEVIDASSAWLCDFEVYKHLSEAKQSRNQNTRLAENVLTVEFETLDYFEKLSQVTIQSSEGIEKLMKFLHDYKLTKAEKLQIVNLLPRTMVEFYLIVEECEDRFDEGAVEGILNFINDLFPKKEEAN